MEGRGAKGTIPAAGEERHRRKRAGQRGERLFAGILCRRFGFLFVRVRSSSFGSERALSGIIAGFFESSRGIAVILYYIIYITLHII